MQRKTEKVKLITCGSNARILEKCFITEKVYNDVNCIGFYKPIWM